VLTSVDVYEACLVISLYYTSASVPFHQCLIFATPCSIFVYAMSKGLTSTRSGLAGVASDEGKKIVAAIREEFDRMRAEFGAVLEEKIAKLVEVKNKEIGELRSEVDFLRKAVAGMEEKIDDGDAYERRDTLVFSGDGVPTATTGELPTEVVCKLVKEQLRLTINSCDVSTAHRLGKKPLNQEPDRRKIVVKLCRRDLKKDILYACRQFKPDFYVNESLTPVRNTVLFVLRKMKRAHKEKITGTCTIDGRVFAWVAPNSAPPGSRSVKVLVNSHAALCEFTLKQLDKPLTEFIEVWPH
jgi:hypothetical protein